MKYITLLLLCTGSAFVSIGQKDIWGVNLGIGSTTYLKPVNPTPEVDFFHLNKLSSHFSIGEELGGQRYSFTKKVINTPSPSAEPGTYLLNIYERCTYLFLSPKIDYSIGKNQRVHAAFSAGPGYRISGNLTNHIYDLHSYYNPFGHGSYVIPSEYDETDGQSIRKMIFRAKLSLMEEIDHTDGTTVALYEEFTYVPTVNSSASSYYYKNTNKLSFPVYYFAIGFSLSGFLDKKTQHSTVQANKSINKEDEEIRGEDIGY